MTIPGSITTTFGGELLHLLPDRAIWWPAQASLVIADLHLGKAASFRMQGIPVPSGSTQRDLSRLTDLIAATHPEQLIILGDFFHAKIARQQEVTTALENWRDQHEHLNVLLIRGNHDRRAGRLLRQWQINDVEEPFTDLPLALLHDPGRDCPRAALAGHIHPATAIKDYDGSIVRIPSFIQDPTRIILPPFGTFTGGANMQQGENRTIFLVAGGRVLKMKQ